ncbi:MAG: UDP-glucose 4-epimerase GalE, partial [Phormidesmis sp.]
MTQSTVLITGGAGYIGSHTVRAMQQAGYKTLVLDNLSCGHRDIAESALKSELVVGDVGDRSLLDHLFATHDIAAVVHFAALAYVGESFKKPGEYYRNNVAGSLTLMQAMVAAGVDQLIFSSTCATYGIPDQMPVSETHPQAPINPYGRSKLMVETIIQDFNHAYGLKSVCFRYFNAAGAHPDGDLGEDHAPEPHLIPRVLYTALGKGKEVTILGTDYETPDGTCIRDYIHVLDLASAHVKGLEYLLAGGETTHFNLGSSHGFSVREIVETARKVTGQPIACVECDRRAGDPPILIADYTKAATVLGWEPQHSDLKTILAHAWAWHQKRHGDLPIESPADRPADRPANLPVDLSQADSPPANSPPATSPLVSVIIPAYNATCFIERTIKSVLNQTYQNLEILVVDDGSSDNTAELVRTLAAVDDRITLLEQRNAGVAAARNLGIAHATGEFIAPLDADDLWHETNIEKQVEVLVSADETVGMVYSWSLDIDEADRLTGGMRIGAHYGNIYPLMLFQNIVGNASAFMVRRSCLEAVGTYSSELRAKKAQGCEDWDIYRRIAARYQVQVIPELLVGYRQVAGSMSTDVGQMTRSRQLALEPIKEQFPDVYDRVSQWSAGAAYIYAARKEFKAHNDGAAWQNLFKALRTDGLVMLTSYSCCTLFIQMVARGVALPFRAKLATKGAAESASSRQATQSFTTTAGRLNDTQSLSLAAWIVVYLRFMFIVLFPSKLLRAFRMRWVAARVCPDQPLPMSVSFWTMHRSRLRT